MDYANALKQNYARSAYGQYDQPVPSSLLDGPDKDLQMQRRRWQTDLSTVEQAAQRGLVSREDVDEIRIGNKSNWVQKLLGLSAAENHNSGGFLETLEDVFHVDTYGVVALANGATAGIDRGEMTYPNPLALSAPVKTANLLGAGIPETFQGPAIPFLVNPVALADSAWHKATVGKWGTEMPLALKIGFSPEAALQSYRHKETWQGIVHKVTPDWTPSWAEGIAGFGLDMALSPSTYLTFGMKAGARVQLAEDAAKIIGESGPAKKQLSKYGVEMYKRASAAVMGRLQREAVANGENVGGKLLQTATAERWSSEIATDMVRNWKTYHAEYMKELQGTGSVGKIMRGIAGASQVMGQKYGLAGEAVQATIRDALGKRKATQLLGYSEKDLFQETSSFLTKERGLYDTTKMAKRYQRVAEALPRVTAPISWALDTANKGWRNSPEVSDWLRLNETVKQEEFDRLQHASTEVFKFLSKDERELVADEVERRHVAESFNETSLTGVAHREVAPHVERAIVFFRQQMDAFLKAEHAAGLNINTVQDYVAHIRNPQAQVVAQDLLRRIPDGSVARTSSTYAHHRAIATLAEGETIFGKDTYLKDAHEIILRRGRASHQMIQDELLFQKVIDRSSYPLGVVHASQQGMSNALLNQWIQRASTGVQTLIPFDQTFTHTVGRLHELGFKPNDSAYNVALLRYLTRPNDALSHEARVAARQERMSKTAAGRLTLERTKSQEPILDGKFSVEGMAEQAKYGFSEAATLHSEHVGGTTQPPPRRLRYRPRDIHIDETRKGEWAGTRAIDGPIYTLNTHDAANMLSDPHYPLWAQVFVGGTKGKSSLTRAYGIVHALDKWTRAHLDAPLPAVIPDFDRTIYQAFEKHVGLQTVKKRRYYQEILGKLNTSMQTPTAVRKLVPVVPEPLIKLAQVTREAHGIWTSSVPPSRAQMSLIRQSAAKVGLSGSMLRDISHNLFGKDRPEFSSEADLLHDFLRPLEGGWEKKDLQKVLPTRLTDWGTLVPLTISVNHRVEGNYWREAFDQNLGTPTKESSGLSTAAKKAVTEGETVLDRKVATKAPQDVAALRAAHNANRVEVEKREKILHAYIDKSKAVAPPAEWTLRQQHIESIDRTINQLRKKNRFANATNEDYVDTLAAARALLKNDSLYQSWLVDIKEAEKRGYDGLETLVRLIGKDVLYSPERKALLKKARQLANTSARKQTAASIKTLAKSAAFLRKDHPPAPAAWQESVTDVNAARSAMQKAHDEFRKSGRALDRGQSHGNAPLGGINPPHEQYADPKTVPQQLQQARELLNKAKSQQLDPKSTLLGTEGQKNLEDNIARLEAQVDDLRQQTLAGAKPEQTGNLRPSTKPVDYKVYVPEGVARVLHDLNAPGMDPEWGENLRKMILVHDQVVGMFKANVMAPFLSFWSRNFLQNAAAVVLETGGAMMDPKDGFHTARDTFKMTKYILGRYTDAFIHEDLYPETMKRLGREVITVGGVKMTRSELEHEFRVSGGYRGMPAMEGLMEMGRVARGFSGASGAGFGLAAGSLVGGTAGAAVDEAVDNEDAKYAKLGAEVGADIGAVFGAFVGARKITNHGAPFKGFDGMTHLVQSRWLPWVRRGEKYTEIPFRIALFMTQLEKTGSISEARRSVHNAFVDYSAMSVFERRVMRRIVPFYAWTKHAVFNSGNQVLDNPANLGAMFKVTHNFNEAMGADPEDVPDNMHEKLTLVGRIGGMKPDNSPYFAVAGIGTPIEDVSQMLSATDSPRDMLREVSGRMSWPEVAAAELVSNKDFQTGRDLTAPKPDAWAGAPAFLRKLVGYREKTEYSEAYLDKPRVAWLMENVPWSRFIYVSKSIINNRVSGAEAYDLQLAARQVMGASLYKVDPRTQIIYENRAKLDAMEALLTHVDRNAIKHQPGGW